MSSNGARIRAIVFDYGGVLMRTVDPRPRRELERDLGLEPWGADRLVYGHPQWDQAQLGHITGDEFWMAIAEELGVGPDGLADFRWRFWSGDRLDADLAAFLSDLREEGYLLGLLSNNPCSLRQRVEELLPGAFDSFVISGCDGVMKPDPAIYRLSVERLGVKPEQAVFVDDYEKNVVAARSAGLQAVHFRGLAPLRHDLRALGVMVADPVLAPVNDPKAVLLAWAGVLVQPPSQESWVRWADQIGVDAERLRDSLMGRTYHALEAGWIGAEEYAQGVAQSLGLSRRALVDDLIRDVQTHSRLDREILGAVRALRRRVRVGLLANAQPGHAAWFRSHYGLDVQEEFDLYVNAGEVGARMPDPAIYELALARLGCLPRQAVLVDAGLRSIDAAGAVGLRTVQFVDAASALSELEVLLGYSLHSLKDRGE